MISIHPIVTAMMPSPPIWIRARMMMCPNSDQCVAVVSTTSPVTQTEVVEVNSAVKKSVSSPGAVAAGIISSSAPTRIVARKPSRINCVVENHLFMVKFVSLLSQIQINYYGLL